MVEDCGSESQKCGFESHRGDVKKVMLYQSSGVGLGFDFATKEEANTFISKVERTAPHAKIIERGKTVDIWFYPGGRPFSEMLCNLLAVHSLIKLDETVKVEEIPAKV